MAPHRRLSIVILYCHPLLGEGIGRLLAREPRAAVTSIDCADADGVASAAAADPDMVVVERGGALDAIGVMRQFPDALVVDIGLGPGPTWVYRRQEIPGDPAALVQLVRRLRGGHPEVSLEPVDRPTDELLVPSGS